MIGGEFDINIQGNQSQWQNDILSDGISTYGTGRSALYNIIKAVLEERPISQVMLPDYLCSSMLVPIHRLGVTSVFYPLNDILEMDRAKFAALYKKGSVVIVINYYGLTDITTQIQYVRSLGADTVIIEDDVQAYYEFEKDQTDADYRFTSLRKWFALPDGGLAKAKYASLQSTTVPNIFHQYKVAGGILKALRNPDYYDDCIYLNLLEKGEELIDEDIEKGMSSFTREHIPYIAVDRISHIRKSNASYIIDGLRKIGITPILPLTGERTPFFVPIWLNNRKKVRQALFQHDVFCPVHWPLEGMPVKKGAEMAEHELSIIIDQRYTHDDMDLILNILDDNIR